MIKLENVSLRLRLHIFTTLVLAVRLLPQIGYLAVHTGGDIEEAAQWKTRVKHRRLRTTRGARDCSRPGEAMRAALTEVRRQCFCA